MVANVSLWLRLVTPPVLWLQVLARVAPGWQMTYAGVDDRPNAPGEYQDTLHLALAALSMAPKLHTLGTDAVCPIWQAQLSLPAFVYLYIKYIP